MLKYLFDYAYGNKLGCLGRYKEWGETFIKTQRKPYKIRLSDAHNNLERIFLHRCIYCAVINRQLAIQV